jgi:hypothetical protein
MASTTTPPSIPAGTPPPPSKQEQDRREPILVVTEDVAISIGTEARACPKCHRMAFLVVNRNGRSLCVDCDAEGLR